MNGKQLRNWRTNVMKFNNQPTAAAALGYGRRQYQKMENNQETIPLCVELSCAALALGITEYDGGCDKQNREG